MIAGILRSPLLHFFVIGAAIYASYAVFNPESEVDESETIRVTAGEIAWMEESWTKRWNRPPTEAELKGLIDQYIRETVLYREALAMGLDQDDVIIRRRLAQKLEFLFQDLADLAVPTDEELLAYFETHRERYRAPETITFTHVFVDPDARGDETLTDAAAILAELSERQPPTEGVEAFGDPFMLQRYYPERSQMDVAKLFGGGFAESVFDLSPGEWHGPVLSGYGTHLVYVHGRVQPPPPSFESVRERVAQDWQGYKREEFNGDQYEALLARYQVVIEDGEGGERVVRR